MENINHAHKPDAQAFDEIRIVTIPRYKSSGMSGDEWRISGEIQLMRKGKIVVSERMSNVENCAYALGLVLMRAKDDGHAFYGGGEDGTCDQEGCAEEATVFYRLKKEFCNKFRHDHSHEAIELKETKIRQFCERHSKRGDCGLEDSDDNYELIDGNVVEPKPEDVKKSVFGGVVTLNP